MLKFGKRFIGSVSTLSTYSLNQLIEMTAIKIRDAIFAPNIMIVGIACVRPYANHITLIFASWPKCWFADVRIAHIGRVIECIGQGGQNLVLVFGWKNIWISSGSFFADEQANRTAPSTESKHKFAACRVMALPSSQIA